MRSRAASAEPSRTVTGALLIVLFLSVTTWAAPRCFLQEIEDKQVFVVHPGEVSCQWPKGTVVIHGRLIFPRGTTVEFVGNVSLRAEAIEVQPGATLKGAATTLHDLTFTATNSDASNIVSQGTLDLAARDDIYFVSKHSIDLKDSTKLRAGDRLSLRARLRNVRVSVTPPEKGAFTLFGNVVDLAAPGARGDIDISGARVGGYRIIVKTRSYLSDVGEKLLRLHGGAVLTTDKAATGLANVGSIQLLATGRIVIAGKVTLDAGTNITAVTYRENDPLCLSNNVKLEANDGEGRIYVRGVRGGVFDDGTTDPTGHLVGDPFIRGACGVPTTTSTSTTTSTTVRRATTTTVRGPTTTTTLPVERLTSAKWRFRVRIARKKAGPVVVDAPKRALEPSIVVPIRADHIDDFNVNDQVSLTELQDLGGSTLARLTEGARAYIAARPSQYPDFDRVVELVWAMRTD